MRRRAGACPARRRVASGRRAGRGAHGHEALRGVRRRTESLSAWDLTLRLDPEPLLGWKGATLFVHGLGLSSTGSPSENAGDVQTLDHIDAPEEWKLYEAWLEQELLGGRLSLLGGLYDVAGEFDVLESAALFVNSSFGTGKDFSQSGKNGPSIFPATSLGVRVGAKPAERGYARLAVLDGVPCDPDDDHYGDGVFALSSEDGVFLVGEIGYAAGGEDAGAAPYTKVGLGGWLYSAEFDRVDGAGPDGAASQRRGSYGAYLLAERVLYREPGEPGRGLAAFARVGFAESGVNPVGFYAGCGAVYTGWFRAQPLDQVGLGVAAAFAGDALERAASDDGVDLRAAEVAIELTYRFQVTPWLAVQPDLQVIVDPGFDPELGDAVALGVRFEAAF